MSSDGGVDDRFGWSVSISGDYAIVGVFAEDEDAAGLNTMSEAGSAYVFERNGAGLWNEAQKIVASDRASTDYFGYSVSIFGEYAIVGAYTENEDATGGNTMIAAGSAYVFERNGAGLWNEAQKIVASDRASTDFFGTSVSISGDDVIVGAYLEEEDATGSNNMNQAGSAYIFKNAPLVSVEIENQQSKTEISVFPNPGTDKVRLEFGRTINDVSLNVMNTLGALVFTKRMNAIQYFDLQLPEINGIYFVQLVEANGTATTIKVVKE